MPAELRRGRRPRRARLPARRRSPERRYLVVGGRRRERDASSTSSSPRTASGTSWRSCGTSCSAGVGILVLLAALVGALLARGTLRPVAQASDAAHSLAEGLLETRLPVEGQDEFGAWAQAFNEMAAALEAKISALSAAQARERRFTADVAHELRTPLTALVGEASLLAEHLDADAAGVAPAGRAPDRGRRPAAAARRGADGDLAPRRRAPRACTPRRSTSAALVAATVRVARLGRASARWRATAPSSTTDPRRLERIVANLVDNALEHGGDGGRPCASARDDAGRGRRRRARDRARAPAAPVRALLQGGPVAQRQRHRPRARDRAGERAPARRRDRGLERARGGQPLHAATARGRTRESAPKGALGGEGGGYQVR